MREARLITHLIIAVAAEGSEVRKRNPAPSALCVQTWGASWRRSCYLVNPLPALSVVRLWTRWPELLQLRAMPAGTCQMMEWLASCLQMAYIIFNIPDGICKQLSHPVANRYAILAERLQCRTVTRWPLFTRLSLLLAGPLEVTSR